MTVASTPEPAADFERFASEAVDQLLAYQPSLATAIGDHRFDDRLEDLRPAAVNDEIRALRAVLTRLERYPLDRLPVGHRVDAEILRNKVAERLFELETLREHEWNPLQANPGTALYLLLARDFAPLDDRLRALAGRLAAVPEQLAAARASSRDMPRVHVETAIDQFSGTLRLLEDEIPAHAQGSPYAGLVAERLAPAVEAVRTHLAWLREQLDQADGDPRLGPELYTAKLALVLDVARRPEDVAAAAWAEVQRVEQAMVETAGRLGGSPQEIFARLAEQAPNDETVITEARSALAEATEFVQGRELVTYYADPLDIIVMPEIHRGVAVAYCEPPGPLDPPDTPTFFAISPAPASWPSERVASFYREYNVHALRNLVVHEAMPGHMLQLAHARRSETPTLVRRAFWSGPFVEGWAVYAEEVMARYGFGGLAVAMQQLKMRLRTALNAVLDVGVHCEGLTEEEALRLLRDRGYQEEGEAVGKWRRALLTSAQLSTYHVGVLEVSEVAAQLRAAHPEWSDRRLHDTLLSFGNPPPRHLPRLLGLE